MSTSKARGIIFVVMSGICWGFSGTCAELLSSQLAIPVPWVLCVRNIGGALMFTALALARTSTRKELAALLHTKKDVWETIIYGIFGVLFCQVGYLMTIATTNAGIGTVLEQLGLIIVVAVTCLRLRRAPHWREVLGVILAIVGTFLICTNGNFGALSIPPEACLWGAVSAIAMACYILLPVNLLQRYSALAVTMPATIVSAIAATVILQPWNYHVVITPEVVLGIGGMTICGTVLAYLLFLEGVRVIGPVLAGFLDTVEPVAAILISSLWLGTMLTGAELLGCALIIAMMILVAQKE